MNAHRYRLALLAAFGLNVGLFALMLADSYLWDSRLFIPLVILWGVVILTGLLLGIFATPPAWRAREAEIERTIVQVIERQTAQVAAAAPEPAPVPPSAPTAPLAESPFTFNGFTLYARDVELKNGGRRTIHFFAKRRPASGHPVPKPAGFHVGVNERTGLPFLKKGVGPDGEDVTPVVEAAYRPQCAALTGEGHQCRNSARASSRYCASHFGYQPPAIALAAARREDTLPRVREAPDTLPSVRRKARKTA